MSAETLGHPAVFIGSDASPYGIVGTYTNHPLGFRTNNIARMFIDTSGNVGIGTTTPGYKLDVNGAINGTAVLVNGVAVGAGGSQWVSSSGGTISYSLGNVGIGTTTPAAKLHLQASGEGVRVQGSAPGPTNSAYVSFPDSSDNALGYVGDGSSGDNNMYLTSYSDDIVLYTQAGRVLIRCRTVFHDFRVRNRILRNAVDAVQVEVDSAGNRKPSRADRTKRLTP